MKIPDLLSCIEGIRKLAVLQAFLLSVLHTVFSQAQPTIPEQLTQKFKWYVEHVPREELFIHTDRDDYISGEALWFNIYLIDRQSFRLSLDSRIAYLELLNESNRPVLQKRILLDQGLGPGHIVIPDTLSTGNYTLRAYTSWMKNFLPHNCFIREIFVFNPFQRNMPPVRTMALMPHTTGSGLPGKAEAIAGGAGMSIDNTKPEMLEIFVQADSTYGMDTEDCCYLFIQTRGTINYLSAIRLEKGMAQCAVPKPSLGEGINHITLFNAQGEPLCERYIYTPPREHNLLVLQVPDSFGRRDKININLLTTGHDSLLPVRANLSITVFPLVNPTKTQSLRDYLIFGTEFGTQFNSWITGAGRHAINTEEMDSILLHLSSNWIDWERILSGKLPVLKYPIEREAHFLMGRLFSDQQQGERSGELVILSEPGKLAQFQYARTDMEGHFAFNLPIDEGLKDLIIMPEAMNQQGKIIIASSFEDPVSMPERISDSTKRNMPSYLSTWSVNYQVRKIYGTSCTGDLMAPVLAPSAPIRFYGKPDIEVIMADYISLPVMEEVFFELLPHVSLKKKKTGNEISITDRIGNRLYDTSPMLFIDGVLIRDPNLIIDMDPEMVEKIDVVKEEYRVGNYAFPGILNVITKAGDFSSVSMPAYMLRASYRVVDPVFSFQSPEYVTDDLKKSRIPDYRTTLYWNPSVKPGKDGLITTGFWSSDNTAEYTIQIQGITDQGETIFLQHNIQVE